MNKVLSLLCAVLFVTSCAELNSVLDSVNKTIDDVSSSKPQSVSAIKLCNDFMSNEITAKKRWGDAYVSISGKVDSIYQDEWGNSNVNLKINRKTRVLATLRSGAKTEQVKRGSLVHVKGIISNVMHTGSCNVFLDRAIL